MPDWSGEIRRRLSAARLPAETEREVIEELSLHLDDRWHELVTSGVPPGEAARLALAAFADQGTLGRYMSAVRRKRNSRAVAEPGPRGDWVADLTGDVLYALRRWRASPVLSAIALSLLALGIGCNAALFSVMKAVLLDPLPFPDSGRLVALYSRYLPSSGYDFPYFALSGPEFADIRQRVEALQEIAAYDLVERNLSRLPDAERILTMRVTARFFDVLGVHPRYGRIFSEEEAQPHSECVAIVGHDEGGPCRIGGRFNNQTG